MYIDQNVFCFSNSESSHSSISCTSNNVASNSEENETEEKEAHDMSFSINTPKSLKQ